MKETPVEVNVCEPSEIYNISKLLGENLCVLFREKNTRDSSIIKRVWGGDDTQKFFGRHTSSSITFEHAL